MNQVYVRPISLSYGLDATRLIRSKKALPLCGNKKIGFSKIQLTIRSGQIKSRDIGIEEVSKLKKNLRGEIKKKIKCLTSKRKNILNLDLFKPSIMGVLNVTPDSFSDGGKFISLNKAVQHAKKMKEEGADIIDVGGESTRPGAKEVSLTQEKKRVLPVIKKIKKYFVSIDTRKSEVMNSAVQVGAKMINDVSALDFDPKSLETVIKKNKPVVLNHSQGTPDIMQNNPRYENVLLDIYDYFEKKIKTLTKKGFLKHNIILDPGIGFGKNLDHNLNIISKVGIFHGLGCPLLIGPSRKSFIGKIMKDQDSKNRLGGTLAAILMGAKQGVQFFRVHDIKEVHESLKVNQALMNI